jgi:hypothetical protein
MPESTRLRGVAGGTKAEASGKVGMALLSQRLQRPGPVQPGT